MYHFIKMGTVIFLIAGNQVFSEETPAKIVARVLGTEITAEEICFDMHLASESPDRLYSAIPDVTGQLFKRIWGIVSKEYVAKNKLELADEEILAFLSHSGKNLGATAAEKTELKALDAKLAQKDLPDSERNSFENRKKHCISR